MNRRVWRAAIIGTGRIASRLEKDARRQRPHTHAGWYRATPRTCLVAGADVDPAALAEFGADWGLPPGSLYRDYRQMLVRERPDIVSVCAYAPDRVAMCEEALAAGARGLWIEKAVACSMAEARRLAAAVEAAGAVAVVDQPRRLDPRYRAVRRLVTTGALGRLETVHALFSGHLLHTGTHAWDVLDLWCGAWRHVTAWLEPPAAGVSGDGRTSASGSQAAILAARPEEETDRGGHVLLEYPSGTRAFVSGARKRFFVFQFDLLFEEGRIQLGNDAWAAWRPAESPRYTGFLELAQVDVTPLVTPADRYPRGMLEDLVQALDSGSQPEMTVERALEALATGLAAFQSNRSGHLPVARGQLDPRIRVVSL